MARRIAVLLLLLCVTAQAATRYVLPTGVGAKDGTSWANAGPPSGNPITWVNSVMAGGDTMYFGPGSYYGQVLVPPTNTSPSDRTVYSAGDGITANYMYDPGVVSLGSSSYTRDQFNQSLQIAKACTLSAASRFPVGSSWTLYSGSVYYKDTTLTAWVPWPNHIVESACQDTTFLRCNTSLANMLAYGAGSVFYDISINRLYVWCTDNADPSTHVITASRRPSIDFYTVRSAEANYVTFYGLDIRTSAQGGVCLYNANADSVWIDHCRITRVGSEAGGNPGMVFTYLTLAQSGCAVPGYDCTYPFDGKGNRLRACYGNYWWAMNEGTDRFKAITAYNQSHFYVESCFVEGGAGLCDWKNNTAPLTGRSIGCVARFNTVKYWSTTAYENLCGLHWYDSCYGNVFIGDPTNNDMKGVWFQWSSYSGNTSYGKYHYVANNTFYQCQNAIASAVYTDDHDAEPGWIKYNIFYGGGQAQYAQFHYRYSNDTCFVSDSNLYYNMPTNSFNRNLTNMSFAAWQTVQSGNWAGGVYHDIHSTFNTVNPNFVSAGTDFRRTGSPAEMDATYGGKRWTSFGAMGGDGTSVNPPNALVYLMADSLRNDFSGETDSLRFRTSTSSQLGNDSVVIAYTLDNSMPSYLQASRRLALGYVASKVDTFKTTYAITEPDTLIVGGWVYSAVDGWSTGLYDTITYATPTTPATQSTRFRGLIRWLGKIRGKP